MIESLFLKVELVCPSCRKIERGKLIQYPLCLGQTLQKQQDHVLTGFIYCTNPQCNQKYPIIEGVPIVLKNFEEWFKAQSQKILKPNDEKDLSTIRSCLNENAKQPNQETQKSTYMDNHYGEYTDTKHNFPWEKNAYYWKEASQLAKSKEMPSAALDLGCCVGRFTFELAKTAKVAVGLDSNFAYVREAVQLQRANGKLSYHFKYRALSERNVVGNFKAPDNALFLVGDALDPPFSMNSFDVVSALNLIDSISVPLILLGQMDALLRVKGALILGSPYTWKSETTSPSEWLETPTENPQITIKEMLTGKNKEYLELKYHIEKEISNTVWTLKNSDNHYSVFLVDLLKAIKC